jgi:hypothetical protein
MVELESNENRQDHPEEGLKDLLVRRVDKPMQKQQDNPEAQLEQRNNDDEGDDRGDANETICSNLL